MKLYFPRSIAAEIEAREETRPELVPTGTRSEMILVVEDDPDVRSYTTAMLCELGYGVVEAADGPAALRLLEVQSGVHLLFTDIGLPGGLNGRQLADEAWRRNPSSRCFSRPAMRATRSSTMASWTLASSCS